MPERIHPDAVDVHNEVARLISSLPDEVREEVALGLTDELLREARGADRLVNKALFDKNPYYAIKRDDLSFAEEAVAIVTGLLAAPRCSWESSPVDRCAREPAA